MRLILPLLMIAVSGAAIVLLLAEPEGQSLLWVAGAGLLIGFLFLIQQALRRPEVEAADAKWAILDGSNVMHWKDQTPSLRPVQDVLTLLAKRGYTAGVVFDANAGYKLSGKYRHDGSLARVLGLPQDRVMVVNKGEPADPMILTVARDLDAIVITEDRFRDWAKDFPEIRKKGRLVRGGYRRGELWLNLPPEV